MFVLWTTELHSIYINIALNVTEVVVSPLRPLAAVGANIELNCTLVGFPDNVTSTSIQFVPPRPPNDGGQSVDIVDRHTARLLYPAVQRKDSYGNVFCKVIGHDQYGQVSLRVAGELKSNLKLYNVLHQSVASIRL